MDEIIHPMGMADLDGRIWIAGNDKKGKLIIELYDDEELDSKKSFGKNIFVSDMKVSGDKLFIVGRSLKSKKEKENFFLKSFKWNGHTIKQSWAVRAKDSGGGREVGTSLLPLSDGGILVGGYFDKTWFLGQRKLIHKLAMFTKSNLLEMNLILLLLGTIQLEIFFLPSRQVCPEVIFWWEWLRLEKMILPSSGTGRLTVGLALICQKLNRMEIHKIMYFLLNLRRRIRKHFP